MKNKKLVIISHTEHYIDEGEDEKVKGWGATINEINFLADYWEEIVHVACLYTIPAPKSALPYNKTNIRFVPIPPFGGRNIKDKLLIFFKVPIILSRVYKSIRKATEVQLRLPTSIGLFLLPFFTIMFSRKFTLWVKYAGNWNQLNAPYSYRVQKFWLKNNFARCKVTINGFWDNQPSNCFSFENPCLSNDEILKGETIIKNKMFKAPFTLCFVGRLDNLKGVNHIVGTLKNSSQDLIKEIHFVGDSDKLEGYKSELSFMKDKIVFHGFLDKNSVHEILEKSHFILLPSASEGFPKVIAEAACYGTIPIVSNVGSIPHYINESNGFIWEINGNIKYTSVFNTAITSKGSKLKEKSIALFPLAKKFTFDNYLYKLETDIFRKKNI
ncbi:MULTISPECIES: glycosyltransferase [Flavobacterium]|uniref:Glycosyltransferase n=1 Tax=Flavobacterium jumunjinense TaxID=998845 RepID=A0ABV5GJ36_9FLAO|nr:MULTISPECIES: glycosyltransferase [Flavobacterium]